MTAGTPRIRRALAAAAIAASLVGPAPGRAAETVEPHLPGWERWFRLDWEVAQHRGRPVLRGSLRNESPYTMADVLLLVEALDGDGRVLAQKVTWASPGSLTPFSHTWFAVPAPGAAAQYRVRVYSYERLEAPSRE